MVTFCFISESATMSSLFTPPKRKFVLLTTPSTLTRYIRGEIVSVIMEDMQNNQSILQKIHDDNPRMIYISGKTCTGKTTLAHLIKDDFECALLELDDIVRKIDAEDESQKFVDAYRHRDNMPIVDEFVRLAKKEIATSLLRYQMVLFEGAVANSDTLAEIVEGNESFLFIYLLPVNLEVYKSRITKRFLASAPENRNGLPGNFWKCFNDSELSSFYATKDFTASLDRSIEKYAIKSMEEAKIRLSTFSRTFSDIFIIEI